MGPITDSSIFLNTVLFFGALAFCALFSFLETSITALRLFQLKELAQTTGRYRQIFESLEQNPNRLLNTILIASNLADVTAATLGSIVMEQLFAGLPGTIGFSLGIFVTTALLLIFGEIVPKNVARLYGERLFASTLWITNLVFYALYPFVTLLVKLADGLVYVVSGQAPAETSEFITSEKEIQFLIDYIKEKGLMEPEKTAMLKSVFELGITPVKEIMVPTPSIIMIDAQTPVTSMYTIYGKYPFSRFPVFEDNRENVIGMLHLKDLFGPLSRTNEAVPTIKELIRPILFIPENVKVNQLLREFRHQHMHIAMVINEFGSIIGLVTLEDVLEEIVGEIRDEYEAVTEKAIALKQGGWLVDASIELDQLAALLGISFERESALTLGGFLTERLQHLPKKGERLSYKHFTFQVQQASSKRVFQVLVFNEQSPPAIESPES